MKPERSKKAIRANCPNGVEKMFLFPDDPVPDGWFATVPEAIAAWCDPDAVVTVTFTPSAPVVTAARTLSAPVDVAPAPMPPAARKRRPGRPRKVKPGGNQ